MGKVFVIELTIIVERTLYTPHLPAHLAYLQQLKQRGVLLLSGPFADRQGGMVIIQAETSAAAEAIAQADPLVSSGVDSYTLREWVITDGLPASIEIVQQGNGQQPNNGEKTH
jgi:uncharacterized protein YciI